MRPARRSSTRSLTAHRTRTRTRSSAPARTVLFSFRVRGYTLYALTHSDFHLIDLLSHFDRERIPERVVHAKGGGAHGFFECTKPLDDLCMADMFSSSGKKCPVTVRFSTVGGESGSHDCARDPRGFSIKFKTEEGNWDWVGNNTPVFFLRDPAKFPHFIHTQKRDPSSHLTGADDSCVYPPVDTI